MTLMLVSWAMRLRAAFVVIPNTKGGKAKFVLRVTRGPVNACVSFDCDGCAAGTVQAFWQNFW